MPDDPINKGLFGIPDAAADVVWKYCHLMFLIILRIGEDGTISVSVLNLNTLYSLMAQDCYVCLQKKKADQGL